MFRDTLRKNGHSGVTDKEMQELLNTFPAEERASRKAAGDPAEKEPRMDFDRQDQGVQFVSRPGLKPTRRAMRC